MSFFKSLGLTSGPSFSGFCCCCCKNRYVLLSVGIVGRFPQRFSGWVEISSAAKTSWAITFWILECCAQTSGLSAILRCHGQEMSRKVTYLKNEILPLLHSLGVFFWNVWVVTNGLWS